MKGIILAGGSGTRLHPITRVVTKQLLPVYNKPMIYYPLSVLMLAGIREVLIISTPEDKSLFQRLFGTGEDLGMHFEYAEQAEPNGIAEALIIGGPFVAGQPVGLILGDNIFYGAGLSGILQRAVSTIDGCALFGYRVKDPERYGIFELADDGTILSIEEKPKAPKSSVAVTGLYFYDGEASALASSLTPSKRGELEITDLNNLYLKKKKAKAHVLGRGYAWLDTGTHDSLLDASQFVATIEKRQGTQVACIEEIAYRMGHIDIEGLRKLGEQSKNSGYGDYIANVVEEELARSAGTQMPSPGGAS